MKNHTLFWIVLLVIFYLLSCLPLRGQSTCGTPDIDSTVFISKPWIGNNKFLEDIVDSVGYGTSAVPKSATGGFDPVALYWVPVKAWVYNDNNGTGGITENEVEESIRLLNEYFSGDVNNGTPTFDATPS